VRICSKCRGEKDFNQFGKNKGGKDGLRSICISCRKITGKKYYQENREKILVASAKWERNNRDKRKLSREKKPIEERRKYARDYFRNHREKIYQYQDNLLKRNFSYSIAKKIKNSLSSCS
jgi:hypothetical protein